MFVFRYIESVLQLLSQEIVFWRSNFKIAGEFANWGYFVVKWTDAKQSSLRPSPETMADTPSSSAPFSVPTTHHLHPGYSHPLLREWQTYGVSYDASNFVYPIFILDEDGKKNEIKSMPGQYQWSVDRLSELLDPLVELGLRSLILFGVTYTKKDLTGTLYRHFQYFYLPGIY